MQNQIQGLLQAPDYSERKEGLLAKHKTDEKDQRYSFGFDENRDKEEKKLHRMEPPKLRKEVSTDSHGSASDDGTIMELK